jgi:hypothetical protein
MANETINPTQVQEIATSLEASRKAKRGKFLAFSIIGGVMATAGIILFIFRNMFRYTYFYVIATILLFGGFILVGLATNIRINFQKEARSYLTSAISKSLFPGSQFNKKDGFKEDEVLRPGFFAKSDRFHSNDLLDATYDDVSFDQCHFQLEKKTNSKNGSSYDTYGQGTIYRFNFTRTFKGRVKVMEKRTNASLVGLSATQCITYDDPSLKKVETEYIEFNNKFEVLASDETIAFYLLTPQMQEKIMSFEGKFKGAFYLALVSNHLYIVVNNSDDSFKIPTNNQITAEDLSPVIELLSIPKVFIEQLHLASYKYKADTTKLED